MGRLEPVKTQEKYEGGQVMCICVCVFVCVCSSGELYSVVLQFFLHRVLKYRGVTLFPWTAKVYDRDVIKNKNSSM